LWQVTFYRVLEYRVLEHRVLEHRVLEHRVLEHRVLEGADMLSEKEVYVSIDIEADGPIPGPHSLLSLGAAAFDHTGKFLSSFERNFKPLPSASPHPDTQLFWDRQSPEVYQAARKDAIDPRLATELFHTFLSKLPGKPVMVGYPVTYDFLFVYWYLLNFKKHSPFSHSAFDIKSLAVPLLGKGFRSVNKRLLRSFFPSQLPHTHRALDDALEQGELFFQLVDAYSQANVALPGLKV